jgi:hypothetical protein
VPSNFSHLRQGDGRLSRDEVLQQPVSRVAVDEAVTVPVAVDHDRAAPPSGWLKRFYLPIAA